MSTPRATVSKILPFSCVDGPGNRFVLFLQGCNFACATCHNPHTMRLCNDCGACIPACHTGALSLQGGRIAFDATLCDLCDLCLEACPIHANPMVQEMDVDDVLERLRATLPFLDGVTLSGGEATTQVKFVTALFRAIKADPELAHLSCMIDSNGHLGRSGWQGVLPWTDGVMLDIKALDPEIHRDLTGVGNALVLQSAQLLHRAGKLQEIRFLVVPNRTNTTDEVAALARFVAALDPGLRLRLNAFQTHGVIGSAADWPPAARTEVEAVADALTSAGLGGVVLPQVYI